MIRQWIWRTALTPEDVFRRPGEWALITPAEARIQSQWAPVVVVSRTPTGERAAWFDEHAAFFRGSGPPAARTLRYYQYAGGLPAIAGVHAVTEHEAEEPEEEVPPEIQPPRAEEVTSWIEVQLLDTLERPVASQKVTIELPDGSLAETRTDHEGLVRLDSIDPGTCRISFVDIDGREIRRLA
jgi:hypothetical protein